MAQNNVFNKERKNTNNQSIMQKFSYQLKLGREDFKLLINILLYAVITLILFLIIEFVQRGTIGTLSFIGSYKKTALLNYILILIFTAPAILFKRTHFAALLFGLPWAVLGILSAILTKFRGVPFSWADFYSTGEGMAIANQYLSRDMLVKTFIVTIITIILLIICFVVRFSKYQVHLVKRVFVCGVMIAAGLLGRTYLIERGASEESEWDIARAYQRNGFVYSFTKSYLDTFREETDGYSLEAVNNVVKSIEREKVSPSKQAVIDVSKDNGAATAEKPNVIMVQVEAFCDPKIIKEAQFNEDPIPNFRKYFNGGYSGYMQVPTIGGATARTEFEVLTGVSLDYLSPGEIPYNSGLTSKEPIETIAYVLKNEGYQTTAIHNFEGNFYSRDKEFGNLGFDRFIPMESMLNLVKYRAFPEDHVLLDYVNRTISSTHKRDFVFTITVGTHGPYSTTLNEGNEKYVSGDLKESTLHQLQNYTSLIRRTDKFIGELAEYIYSLEEPTVLVVYSDHYPKLEAVDSLTEKQKFRTPYFIIDNQDKLPKSKENDIEAYQLSTNVFNLSHLQGGIMNVFHNAYKGKEDYQTELELIQYDMLFGKKYCMDNENPYTPTDIQIGLEKLEIAKAEHLEDNIIIQGTGFTESSRVFLNNELLETEFISENELVGKNAKDISKPVQVKLLGRNDEPILSSNSYTMLQ